MNARSMVQVVVVAVALAGCASEPSIAPTEPMLVKVALGNPPPPRVLGKIIASFSIVDPAGVGAAQAFTFRSPAFYNRNLTTGMNFLELTVDDASVRADTFSVKKASGIATLVDSTSGATLTVDLSQLSGFTGPLFLTCPGGTPVNCFSFNATLTGTIRLANGQTFPAVGTFQFRWETL